MVRHIVDGIAVETVGVIVERARSVERVGVVGRNRVPRGGGKEVRILRHLCSPPSGMWCTSSRESALEVLRVVLARNQRKSGVPDNCISLFHNSRAVTPKVCETNAALVATGLAWNKDRINTWSSLSQNALSDRGRSGVPCPKQRKTVPQIPVTLGNTSLALSFHYWVRQKP